jgi:hypothetical protein
MNGDDRRNRWATAAVAIVAAAVIGTFAYQLGTSHALARAGEAAGYPAAGPIPYGWHRPWGFGFLFPLFFIGFWFVIVRGLFWGGPWRRRWHAAGPYDTPQRFDEWHPQAGAGLPQSAVRPDRLRHRVQVRGFSTVSTKDRGPAGQGSG